MTLEPREPEDWLIQRAIEYDKVAFASLYDMYIDRVYRHVYYRVSNRVDAEDITQDVFIRAWKAIGKYKRTGAPFMAWLTTIAHNLIVDYYRASRKLVSLEEEEASGQADRSSPEEVTEATLDQAYIREAVLKLKGEKQKVVLMRFIDGLTYSEIARALNKSEGAVRVLQYRALNDLRSMLMRSE